MSYDPATYIEGVPVKISEKYRPPRKVTLSSLCNYQVNAEVLTTEYDTTTELETKKWLQNLKNYKDNRVQIRKEKIKKYEEDKEEKRIIKEKELEEELKRKEEEEEVRKLEEEKRFEEKKKLEEVKRLEEEEDVQLKNNEEEAKVSSGNEEEKEVESDVKNSETESEVENKHGNNVANDDGSHKTEVEESNDNAITYKRDMPVTEEKSYSHAIPSHISTPQSVYLPMLVPTQISLQSSHQKSPTKPGNNINFADFESDANDPFDRATLNSINDMEELAKVLQASNVKQQNPMEFGYQQQGTYMNGGYSYNPYSYNNYQPPPNLPPSSSLLYNQLPSYHTKITPSPNTSVPLTGKPNLFQQDNFSVKNYTQWNNPNNSNSQPANASQYKPYSYGSPQNLILNTNNSNRGLPADTSFSNIGTTYQSVPTNLVTGTTLTGGNLPGASSGVESVGKRQDLVDFYTRYYSNNKKSTSGVRSGETTPLNQQNMKGTLSSSSSVPDLTVSEDNEVSNIIANNQFGKLGLAGSSNSTPVRPLSTGGYEMNRSMQTGREQSPCIKNRLPDPFAELNEEAQTIVQNLAEMGFPRPRVARAVQKLGTDHKKLLEVLLTLQSFQENGDDECLSERAFYFFMGEVSKVNEFLIAAKTLLDLGFEEEKVVERLFKYGNDKEKCLEELISLNT